MRVVLGKLTTKDISTLHLGCVTAADARKPNASFNLANNMKT